METTGRVERLLDADWLEQRREVALWVLLERHRGFVVVHRRGTRFRRPSSEACGGYPIGGRGTSTGGTGSGKSGAVNFAGFA